MYTEIPAEVFVRSANDIYVFAFTFWHYDGEVWSSVALPDKESVPLGGVFAPDGRLYAFFGDGAFLRFWEGRWSNIEKPSAMEWSPPVVTSEGEVWIRNDTHILRLTSSR